VTRVDWIAVAIASVSAFGGLRRGLIATALSLAGLAAGAIIGARLAPHLLHNGSSSPYTPLAGLVGAMIGAMVVQTVASFAGASLRKAPAALPKTLRRPPAQRATAHRRSPRCCPRDLSGARFRFRARRSRSSD